MIWAHLLCQGKSFTENVAINSELDLERIQKWMVNCYTRLSQGSGHLHVHILYNKKKVYFGEECKNALLLF
jgi:hypothetical protein